MTLMSALLLLFLTQTPQDDREKWEREHVEPTKERIEAALKSDSQREWWEGRFTRVQHFIHGGDQLLLAGGEFYEKRAKVTGGIGKASFAGGKVTMIHRTSSSEYPEWKEIYTPVRWGKQVLLLQDSEIELLSFCNEFNSGDLPRMRYYYATDHQVLSLAEIFRNFPKAIAKNSSRRLSSIPLAKWSSGAAPSLFQR